MNDFKTIVAALLEVDAPVLANEAAIYYKTALFCHQYGKDAALDYYFNWHSEDEYLELVGAKKKPQASAARKASAAAAIQDFLNRIENVRLRTTGSKKKGPAQKVGRPKKGVS